MTAQVLVLIAVLLAHLPLTLQGPAGRCWCAEAVACDGWCQHCRAGYFSGVRIPSRALYDAVDSHGHEVFEDRTRCQVCRELIATGGFCRDCQMGYVRGVGYFGRLGYHMAEGRRVPPWAAAVLVQSCRGWSGGLANGWSAGQGIGVSGTRVFADRMHFGRARQYRAILQEACIKSESCEDCALAMVADARCPFCRIDYFEGHPIKER